jgi:FKBP-type peptidyl-prolyl cis-trans isomerase 2
MKLLAVLAIAIVLIAAGCSQQPAPQQSVTQEEDILNYSADAGVFPTAATGDVVEVDYIGRLENGTVFDTSVEAEAKKAKLPLREKYEPLRFTVGAGQMITGFDAAVVGMKEGDEKNATIPPEQAYGKKREDLVLSIPVSNIQGGDVEVGMVLVSSNMRGVVTDISGGNATVDFNHELAGKTLVFTIKMVKIEKKY